MKGSLIQRGRVASGALSLMISTMLLFLLLSGKCSGNPIEITYSPPPAPAHMLEIAGMAASYEEGQPERILSFVVNEYEYEESAAAVLGMIRIGSAREGEDSRRIVRQSVCYDTKMQAPERFNIVLTKHCKERARDEIIQSEEFTLAMIEQVVSQMEPSDRIIFEYRYTESEDLLEFDLQLRPYDVENQWSENVIVRRPDWNCFEQTFGWTDCLWQPDDAEKRKIKGLT